jgi:hypothetical protein
MSAEDGPLRLPMLNVPTSFFKLLAQGMGMKKASRRESSVLRFVKGPGPGAVGELESMTHRSWGLAGCRIASIVSFQCDGLRRRLVRGR